MLIRMLTRRRGTQVAPDEHAACACARAWRPRPRRRRRGCALSWRRRRARPRPRAQRLRRPRARGTPCGCRGRCSRVRSAGRGPRPPHRRAPLDATGRRPCGCRPSAGAASAPRPPHPFRALLGAQRALRRRRSMRARTRCGPESSLAADMPQRAQAARPSGRRRAHPTLQLYRCRRLQYSDGGGHACAGGIAPM